MALTTNGKLTGTGTFLGAVGLAPERRAARIAATPPTQHFALYGRSGSWIDSVRHPGASRPQTTFVNSPPNLTNPGAQSSIVGTQGELAHQCVRPG